MPTKCMKCIYAIWEGDIIIGCLREDCGINFTPYDY